MANTEQDRGLSDAELLALPTANVSPASLVRIWDLHARQTQEKAQEATEITFHNRQTASMAGNTGTRREGRSRARTVPRPPQGARPILPPGRRRRASRTSAKRHLSTCSKADFGPLFIDDKVCYRL
jgi:hypothetical protein